MKLKYRTTAEQKRRETKDYFDSTTDWVSIRLVSEHLACSMQATRYYVNQLFERGYLESCSMKATGSDGIARAANHYRKKHRNG